MACPEGSDTLLAWRQAIDLVSRSVEGLAPDALDRRVEGSTMSIRETVHHLVEANLVATSIVTAALGSPRCVFDWSWMMPFGEWLQRMGYDRKPLGPSLRLLEALGAWVAAQVEPLPDGLARTVRLRDAPDAELREVTVADVLLQEVGHVREHLGAFRRLPPPSS